MKAIDTFISLFFLFFSLLSFSQQPGFNYIRETEYPRSHFRDMIIDNDTILGIGVGFSDSVEWKQGIVLAKFDSSGTLLDSKIILDSLGDKLAVDKHWGKIIKTSGGGYAMTAATVYRKSAFLIKLSHDLEVEFIKEYPDTVNLANYSYKLIEINNGYLLYGSIQRPNFKDDPFIRRVDKLGNTVWFKYYGNYNLQDGFNSIDFINDSLFVLAGARTISQNVGVSFIQLIDSYGEVTNSWTSYPDPEIGYLRRIFITDDGGFFTFGQYVVDVISNNLIVQPTLTKLDSNFQVEWVKHYGLIRSLNAGVMLWDIEPTLDGNFIGAGQSTIILPDDVGLISGWLFKFSLEGDSIWSRYDMGPYPPHYTNNHFFGGVGVLSSGSIVAGGSASEGQKKYIWLVKVTTDGCMDTLFCGLVDAKEAVMPEQQAEVRVYPNPASDYLMVEHHGAMGKDLHFSLFDATGRLVLRHKTGPAGAGRIDVSGLAPGLYFFKAEREGVLLRSGKVVIYSD
jgi:Secretion system C-terminal sorting domain